MKLGITSFGALALSLLGASGAQAAGATTQGFALDTFNPSERGSEWFALDSLDFRGQVRPSFGVIGDFAYQPLVIYDSSGAARSNVVSSQVYPHVGAAMVLFNRVRFGVDAPIAFGSSGDGGSVNGANLSGPSGAAFGDLRLAFDVKMFGEYGGPVTAAIGAQLFVPTGSPSQYTGDGKVRFYPHLLFAGDIGSFVYGADGALQVHAASGSYAGSTMGSTFGFGASAGVRLAKKRLVIGPELYGSTQLGKEMSTGAQATSVESVAGFHYTAGWVRFGMGAGPGLTRGLGTPKFRGLASFEVAAPLEEKPLPVAEPSDRDGDGIVDADDACPDEPGRRSDDLAVNGCPDKDGDGIVDKLDACVDVKGVGSDDPKKNGCPADMDRDGDGVLDAVDACPDEPGAANDDPKKNGCPKAAVVGGKIQISDQVKFKTGSAELLPGKESEDVLAAVATVLKDHPEIQRVRVEGHTDDRGLPADNKVLSAARAASVVKWLVEHGVDRSRLSSQGYGQEEPIDTNETEEGRHNNRRVEFHILKGDQP